MGSGPDEAVGSSGTENTDPADRVLRAKYLDWCSARVAGRLFTLRPEEIYELSSTLGAGTVPGGDPGTDFRAIVGRLTEELSRELGLPSFGEWRVLYAQSPRQFDEEMIGFWRESV